jgi:hypothetical protein
MNDRTSLAVRVLALVRHAVSKTGNEHEARNAAMKVCEALDRYPGLLNDEVELPEAEEFAVAAYTRTGKPSEIHPIAKAHLEWEAFKTEHNLQETGARRPSLCLACGSQYFQHDAVLEHQAVGATHRRCAEWWRDFDFSVLPNLRRPEDDIPF